MRSLSRGIFLAACLLEISRATPVRSQADLQAPLEDQTFPHHLPAALSSRQLHGRFLHITDIHPDPYYKIHSSTAEDDACHRGKGLAGTYGAETSDCDSPFALVNATFKWIQENLRDQIDFVVWTGDSARHDNDEKIPRTEKEVLNTNKVVAQKFLEVFSTENDPDKGLEVPIVPTFGNNDILPHNILLSGPNKWLKSYTSTWKDFIPEEQRHGFEKGGWYYVEVIPNKLAVFSLNTLYFFDHNAAVDGCSLRSEPGFDHFEWLRIQLQFMRERGMKAILSGHIPPARTESKQLWDESCWQKYTLWLQQYRDVIVGGLYGHMNIDHFMLQDSKQIDLLALGDETSAGLNIRTLMDEELSIESANDYLEELRENWSDIPDPSPALETFSEAQDDTSEEDALKKKKKGKKGEKGKKGKKSKKDKALKKIGGPWGERFQLTLVAPSVVPNYFPTLRIVEYNITGLDPKATWASAQSLDQARQTNWMDEENDIPVHPFSDGEEEESIGKKKKGKKHKKKPKKPKNPDLVVPHPPSKSSPPGPAYSPQTLSMLGYTQYFANLTHLNNDDFVIPDENDVEEEKWREGKHKGKHPKTKPHPKPFKFQVEYDTFTDPIYQLRDLTVGSYIKLAHRIGQYKPLKDDRIDDVEEDEVDDENDSHGNSDNNSNNEDKQTGENKKKHKDKKHHKQHEKNKVWLRFVRRAFVGTLTEEELTSFEEPPEASWWDKVIGAVYGHGNNEL